jgi:uncharacterized membrane protein
VATLTAFEFDTPTGADEMLTRVQQLQAQGLITIQDAAIVRWPEGAKKPKTQQLHNLAGAGALTGSFWGLLFGLLFFVPIFGLAIGAAFGALAGHFADVGIDDNFINQVKGKVTPGTSAIFLMTSNVIFDRVRDALSGMKFEVISTNLSAEQEAKLREAFADEDVTTMPTGETQPMQQPNA